MNKLKPLFQQPIDVKIVDNFILNDSTAKSSLMQKAILLENSFGGEISIIDICGDTIKSQVFEGNRTYQPNSLGHNATVQIVCH